MSITVYNDVFLPVRVVEAGVRGKQVRRNSRVVVDSGAQAINIVWTQTLRQYEIGFIPMAREAWQAVETIHEITEGGAFGFLLIDPKDHRVDSGVMYSLTSTTFQLYKRYLDAASGRYKDRKITRPKASGFMPTISGVAIDPVNYTLDADTGIVTIPSAPAEEDLAWTGPTYVPVHFMDDTIDWQMIAPSVDPNRRFIAGPTLVLQEVRE